MKLFLFLFLVVLPTVTLAGFSNKPDITCSNDTISLNLYKGNWTQWTVSIWNQRRPYEHVEMKLIRRQFSTYISRHVSFYDFDGQFKLTNLILDFENMGWHLQINLPSLDLLDEYIELRCVRHDNV